MDDVNTVSIETDCLKAYIAKGIAVACFIYARCLDLGRGTKVNKDLAQTYYKRVSASSNHISSEAVSLTRTLISKSYAFDPEQCKLMQNHVTYQQI